MVPTRSYGGGSVNSGSYSHENAESLRFEEEIQSLMLQPTFESPAVTGSSFTALLGLPPTEAVELLHDPARTPALGFHMRDHHLPLGCSPTFPSNAALVDRAARFSVFAAEDSPEVSNSGGIKLKAEPVDSGDRPPVQRIAGKRKEADKNKVKGSGKKSKSAEENTGGEKLPYVHVRARRGQATDSHSLAERARREKINARMKLLQELVPGCNKISGTALVLEEIINHVQSLQRQVEFLSMRLAAVNPGVDFSGLDNILSSECGRLIAGSGARGTVMMEQLPWLDGMINGLKRHPQQQQQQQEEMWLIDHHHQQQPQPQQQVWERDDTQQSHVLISNVSTPSFCHDSSVSLPSQLKTEQ